MFYKMFVKCKECYYSCLDKNEKIPYYYCRLMEYNVLYEHMNIMQKKCPCDRNKEKSY